MTREKNGHETKKKKDTPGFVVFTAVLSEARRDDQTVFNKNPQLRFKEAHLRFRDINNLKIQMFLDFQQNKDPIQKWKIS